MLNKVKDLVKNLFYVVPAILGVITLCFPILHDEYEFKADGVWYTYIHNYNAFEMLNGKLMQEYFYTNIYTTISIIFLIFTVINLLVAGYCVYSYINKTYLGKEISRVNFTNLLEEIVVYFSGFLSLLYLIFGIVVALVKETDLLACYIPLILQLILLVVFICCIRDTRNPEAEKTAKIRKEKNMERKLKQQNVMQNITEKSKSNASKYFNLFCALPTILFWTIFIVCSIYGVIDGLVFERRGYYGIMRIPSYFLNLIIWVCMGLVSGYNIKWLLSIISSGHIIRTQCLIEIKESLKNQKSVV